tara:strand:- start:1634 stop:3118 length:1485 start_codon:yes stop_codon:yes gene_type:complete
MAYTINKFSGTQLTVVEDGTIDQTTDLKLVGKNYAGYGEIQNENFVFLLENFASANQPPKPLGGQVWFDSGNSKLKFYDGSKWRTTGGAEVSGSTPAGLSQGDFWWDTTNEQLYAYNGSSFVLVGPQGVGDTVTQFRSATIRDNGGTARPVITSLIADEVIHIISAQQFTIGSEDAASYPGFDVIRQGITLKNTQNSTNGVTSTNHRFYGTASNADKLGGVDAANFVQTSAASFTSLVEYGDAGIAIGASNDLVIKIVDDDKGLIANEQGQEIYVQVNNASSAQKMPVRFQANKVLPGYSNISTFSGTETVDIGSSTNVFANMYATTFNGTATVSQALEVSGQSRSGSTGATPNTVAIRDATGNLTANEFDGVATSAKFADLAEKYTTDQEYPVGTAMCVGGDEETTSASASSMCIGVISNAPAYLMNSECDGQAIGLKGRLPVRVNGIVKKGDPIYVWQDGVCSTVTTSGLVGIALEDNDEESEKLVECILKV